MHRFCPRLLKNALFLFQNLVSLNLTNCVSLSPRAITECLSGLPRLRTLILKQTKVNDQTMRVIASSLSNLTHLDLHACPVTDKGATWFCGDHGDFDPVCRDLTLLDISATKIDLAGCSAIVLCYPKLRYLSFPDSIEAVARLHKGAAREVNNVLGSNDSKPGSASSSSSGGAGPSSETSVTVSERGGSRVPDDQHRLEILHATALRCRRIDPDSVWLACRHCPNVREVYWYQDATDEALGHLLLLQHLSVLEVTSDRPQAVTFHGGVLPLLRVRGEEMLSLGLYDIQDVDLGLLGSLCPRLRRLKVVSLHEEADFCHSFLTAQQRAASFTALRQLTLVLGSATTRLDSHNVEHLLVNACGLQELHLIDVHCLTDDVLIAALSVHGFLSLKQVRVFVRQ